MHLSLDDVASVLSGVQDWWPALSRLSPLCGQLDHGSAEVRRLLSLVVLRAVVLTLQHTLNFSCVALYGSPGQSEVVGGGGCQVSFDSPRTLDGSEDVMQVEEAPIGTADTDGVRKRQRDEPGEEDENGKEVEEADDTCKKPRVVATSDAMATLREAAGDGLSSTYTCSAYSNTWVHRRQARRHRGGDPVISGTAPVLSFTLTASSEVGEAIDYVIEFKLTDLDHLSELHTFYAFFKKYLCKQR